MSDQSNDESKSDSSVELLEVRICDSEDDGSFDPVARAVEISRAKRKSKVVETEQDEDQSGISDDKVELLDRLFSCIPNNEDVKSVDVSITTENEVSQEITIAPEIDKEPAKDVNISSNNSLEKPKPEPKKIIQPVRRSNNSKRTSSLAELCSKTNNIRSRTGLSKRVKISSLHPSLNNK